MSPSRRNLAGLKHSPAGLELHCFTVVFGTRRIGGDEMTKRGGRRGRRITPSYRAGAYQARVHCPGGRWGPRRVRTSECHAVLKAEDFYTALLKDDSERLGPGCLGSGSATVSGRQHTAQWEVRSNSVWRRGRVFLICPQCLMRCTRLYLPLETSWLACRRCWGLTYGSRTLQNYKDTPWGRGMFRAMFGTTQRDWALMTTGEKRQLRSEASRERWKQRRSFRRREPA